MEQRSKKSRKCNQENLAEVVLKAVLKHVMKGEDKPWDFKSPKPLASYAFARLSARAFSKGFIYHALITAEQDRRPLPSSSTKLKDRCEASAKVLEIDKCQIVLEKCFREVENQNLAPPPTAFMLCLEHNRRTPSSPPYCTSFPSSKATPSQNTGTKAQQTPAAESKCLKKRYKVNLEITREIASWPYSMR